MSRGIALSREDFDSYKPCFQFQEEFQESFYVNTTSTPSEDIWKKFELLPTPPRSPRRDDDSVDNYGTLTELQLVSELLDNDITQTCLFPLVYSPVDGTANTSASNNTDCRAKLIQDCMWGGKEDETDKSTYITNLQRPTRPASLPSLGITSGDCVEPSVIFPYPLNDDTRGGSLANDTPSDSEEEIDVVTVEKSKPVARNKKYTVLSNKPSQMVTMATLIRPITTISVASPPMSSPAKAKRSYSMPASPQHKAKRAKRDTFNIPDLKSAMNRLRAMGHHDYSSTSSQSSRLSSNTSSTNSSDSEECEVGKRTQHNVLERKRRNDLKYSFVVLRDQVPALHKQERAAKVVILKKATEYILGLDKIDRKLDQEVDFVQSKNDQLRQRLHELQRTTNSIF